LITKKIKNLNQKVGVLGCGWLGLTLAQNFSDDRLTGILELTNRPPKMDSFGKANYHLSLLVSKQKHGIEGIHQGFLDELDLLIINFHQGLRSCTQGKAMWKKNAFIYM